MDQRTLLVWRGILNLNPQQQQELVDEWNSYNRSTAVQQREKKVAAESFRVVLGPVSDGTCTCCGR
ncbi:hypothetical protein [Micromonospora sp. 4G55]|uniref:hypothetical protein n=1 Tax=Micromonospora sp. 4G55 TaxID=2806102 RepID=UPI001A50F6FC|nr:hypothetical protein [Micromonospora sp. 4G55]MBM0258805.1 hypothetical protein [Micromonospora sp. 4G55]